MKLKEALLDCLRKDQLKAICEELEVDADKRSHEAMVAALASSKKAKPEHSQGVAFFNRFRDLTASGFFSSELGVQDLQYQGNTFVMEWQGCPPEALAKLGVSYPS